MEFRGKDLRRGRYSAIGQIYHVITVTKDHQPVFTDNYSARLLIQTLKFAHEKQWVDSLCFVVMPDHLHWLFSLVRRKSYQK